ncbi:MAG: RNA polymerase sigma factor, partial [Chitinophagaceae bacterium]
MHLIAKNNQLSSRFNQYTDAQLLQQFYNDGNNQWIGILLQRYTLLLLGTCVKYLKSEEVAKDAVQQIFLKVLAELPKYQVTYFKSWLYMIAKNHCLMELRNKNSSFSVLPESGEWEMNETADIEDFWQHEQTLQLLEKCIEQLNAEQQLCVKLFYLQKCSYQQITQQSGYSLLQVKSYIQNGKRNLKLLMEK